MIKSFLLFALFITLQSCNNDSGIAVGYVFNTVDWGSNKLVRIHSGQTGINTGMVMSFLIVDSIKAMPLADSALMYGWKIRINYKGYMNGHHYVNSIQVLDRHPPEGKYQLFD